MQYLVLFLVFLSSSAFAETFKIDDGVRMPKNMVVSGNSVIDDESVDNDIEIPERMSEEEQKLLEKGTEGFQVGTPITPEVSGVAKPEEPKKNVRQVVKKYQPLKVRRSISDDRIDDSYVQEMLKGNTLFTPHNKK